MMALLSDSLAIPFHLRFGLCSRLLLIHLQLIAVLSPILAKIQLSIQQESVLRWFQTALVWGQGFAAENYYAYYLSSRVDIAAVSSVCVLHTNTWGETLNSMIGHFLVVGKM